MPDETGAPKARKSRKQQAADAAVRIGTVVPFDGPVVERTRQKKTREHFVLQGKMLDLYRGDLSVEDMDDEELSRLQFKDKNGRFTGRPPANLPRSLVDKLRQELLKRASAKFDSHLIDSITVLGTIMKSDQVNPSDRIKAAVIIIDRVMGKTPEKVELTAELKPWQNLVHDIDRALGAPDEGLEGLRTIDG